MTNRTSVIFALRSIALKLESDTDYRLQTAINDIGLCEVLLISDLRMMEREVKNNFSHEGGF
jgi:hypothetical protein